MVKIGTSLDIIEWIVKYLVGIYLTLVVFTNLALLLDYRYGTTYAPYFDAIILIAVVPLAALHYKDWLPFMKTDFFKWCVLLAMVYAINYLRLTQGGYQYSDLDLVNETNRLQRVILWPVIGFIIYTVDFRYLKTGFFIALVTMPALVLLDFLNPHILASADETIKARAQGSYLNANIAGEALVLLGILNMKRFKGTLGIAFILIIGVGVILTFSRSGMVALVLLFTYMYWKGHLPKQAIIAPIFLVLSFSTLLIYAEDVLLSLGYDSSVANVLSRLSFFETAVDSEQSLEDLSSESRMYVAKDVLADSLAKPFSGYVFDAEAKHGMNPHNEPLFLWYTFGLTGLIAWIGMVVLLVRAGIRTGIGWINPAVAVFLWFSMFSHNLLELRFWIIALAIFTLSEPNSWHRVKRGSKAVRARNQRRSKSADVYGIKPNRQRSKRRKRKTISF